MSGLSDGIALTDLDTNNIFVIRRNSGRENNVSLSTPSLVHHSPEMQPQSVDEGAIDAYLTVPSCLFMVRNWFTRKWHSVSPKLSPENAVDDASTIANSEGTTSGHSNTAIVDVSLEASSEERTPPNGSREFLVNDTDNGECIEKATPWPCRIRDWFTHKWQGVDTPSPNGTSVIDLRQVGTGNIFEVSQNACDDEVLDTPFPENDNGGISNICLQQLVLCYQSSSTCVTAQSSHSEFTFNWSILHAWNIVAYASCSSPYRLVLDKDGNYTIKSHILQQIAWLIQMALVIAGLVSRFAFIAKEAHLEKPDPFEYIKLANAVATALTSIVFMKVVSFSHIFLLKIHQNFGNNNNRNLPHLHAKKLGLTAFVSFGCFLFVMLVVHGITYVYDFYGTFHLSPATVLQTFACFTRQTYSWREIEECGEEAFVHLSDVPATEILLGLVGILTFIFQNLFRHNLTLAIFACSLTLLTHAWYATSDEAYGAIGVYQLTAKHNLLTDLSHDISIYIGGTLLLQMTSVAFTLSLVLKMIFVESNTEVITLILSLVMNLLSFLTASVSAMLIEQVEDEFNNPSNLNQLPNNAVAATQFLLKLFKTSIGIGYPGLFLLNFRFLVGYVGVIGTLTKVLYETTKETV